MTKVTDAPSRRRRLLLMRLVLLGVSLLIPVLLSELALRFVAPQRLVRRYYAADAELGNVIRADQRYVDRGALYTFTVRTNDGGFRMDEPVDWSPSRRRVLVLGDSFVFGWSVEVEDSFFTRTARALSRRLPSIQLLNGGVGAYSSGHVYKTIERRTDELDVCSVIYFLNSNDLADNLVTSVDYRVTSYRRSEDGSIELRDERVRSPMKRFLVQRTPYGWLSRHSHLFTLIKRLASGSADASQGQGRPAFGLDESDAARGELAVAVTRAHLERIGERANGLDLPLLVIWIPGWTELFDADSPLNETFRDLKSSVGDIEGLVFHDPLPQLRGIVADDGVGMLDMYYEDGDPVGHFNRLGNEIYARAIEEPIGLFLERCSKESGQQRH